MMDWLRHASLASVVLAGAMLAGCAIQGGGASDLAEPVAVHGTTCHQDPALTDYSLTLINSSEQQASLGAPEVNLVDVDFATQSLVVLAMGEQPIGGYWVAITGVHQQGDTLYVQATVNRPGEGDMVTQAMTYPFCAAVIDKTQASTLFVEPLETVGLPGGP